MLITHLKIFKISKVKKLILYLFIFHHMCTSNFNLCIQVGGDGCIFVWKVPASLSSRMLQRMKENLGPLSSSSLAQPVAFSKILLYEEEDRQCRINPEDVMLPENSSQIGQKTHYQHGGPRQTSAFKFTVSRLPRWAQAKVTSSDVVPMNLNFTLSQVSVYTILLLIF